jgi:hypothetical protein
MSHAGHRDPSGGITKRAVTTVLEGSWRPAPGTTDHRGRPLTADHDFFVAPPSEIRTVLSAYTSLRKGAGPRGLVVGVLAAAGLGGAGFGALWVLMRLLEPKDLSAAVAGGVFGAFLGGLIGWGLARFKHVCSYVGQEGIARFVCSGRRGRVTEAEVLLFSRAAEVRTILNRRYQNGVYRGTEFSFDWTDDNGTVCFQITGKFYYNYRGENPWLHAPYQWGLAAESAWTRYQFDRVRDEIVRNGFARFNLTRGDFLRVGPGVLELALASRNIRCEIANVEKLALSEGVYTLMLRGGREGFFSSPGVFKFSRDSVANAQLFELVLESIGGLRISV